MVYYYISFWANHTEWDASPSVGQQKRSFTVTLLHHRYELCGVRVFAFIVSIGCLGIMQTLSFLSLNTEIPTVNFKFLVDVITDSFVDDDKPDFDHVSKRE